MYLSFCVLVFLLTTRCIYIGGRTLNDHIVVIFVLICMMPYILAGWMWENPVFGLGNIGIFSLFAVLVQKKEAKPWMMPFVLLSQPAYAVSFWCYFFIPLQVFIMWLWSDKLSISYAMIVLPLMIGCWGCVWTWLKNQHCSEHRLGDKGIRLVHLSDIHASPLMRGLELDTLFQKVNDLEPDIICITGDFVMPFSEEQHNYLRVSLRKLNAPIFCCMGNHDLPIQNTLIEEFAEDSHNLLIDEQADLTIRNHKISIFGLQFHWKNAKEKSLAALASFETENETYRIVLAHDPRYFRWIQKENCDLVLSGHTHGGQLALNMMGFSWSPLRLLGVYDQGMFQKDACILFVHKGNWSWGLPPRMGVAPEIAVLTL